MKGTVLYGRGDIRFQDLEDPKIAAPTNTIIRMPATCVCASDLWPYRQGAGPSPEAAPSNRREKKVQNRHSSPRSRFGCQCRSRLLVRSPSPYVSITRTGRRERPARMDGLACRVRVASGLSTQGHSHPIAREPDSKMRRGRNKGEPLSSR